MWNNIFKCKKIFIVSLLSVLFFVFFGCNSNEQALEVFSQGKLEYAKKNLVGAAELFEESISHDSDFLPAYIMLGKSYYFNGEFEKAEKTFKKSIEKFPGNSTSRFWLGRIYLLDDSKLADAKNEFNMILQGDDTYFEAHYYLAKLYEKEGKIKEALLEYNKAKLIKQGFEKIHRDLGKLYERSGFKDRAEEELSQITKRSKGE